MKSPPKLYLQKCWISSSFAIPSADFGGQEFAKDEEIQHFCKYNFGVNFPVSKKEIVSGDDAHPFYKQARKTLGFGSAPKWNFHKYLINRNGKLVDFFNSTTTPQDEKLVFKTAQEIDQRWIIDLAAERQEYICQAQSLNIFLPGNVSKKYLHEIHFRAWHKGLKSLYYCRSTSVQRADKVSNKTQKDEISFLDLSTPLADAKSNAAVNNSSDKYEECLACQ